MRRKSQASVAAVVVAGAGGLAAGAIGPIDNTFDWTGCQRALLLEFDASATGYNLFTGGQTMAQAFQQGADIWNAANTGWTFRYVGDNLGGQLPGNIPRITVRMGNFVPNGGMPGPIPGNDFGPPSGSLPPDIDGGIEGGGGGGGGGGGVSRALAIFRLTGFRVNDRFSTGEIVVNPLDPANGLAWGYFNDVVNGIPTYDPIITALHELGHALRLDHNDVGGNNTIMVGAEVGPVMRSKMARGVHQVNPILGGAQRNLHMDDIDSAVETERVCVPTPGAGALLSLGLLAAARRRR